MTEHWFRPVPLPERGLGRLRQYAARWLEVNWDIRVHGEEHVPSSGPVILAANHIGWLDGPLLFLKAPRPAHALVKSELFVGRVGRLLRLAAQIPVTRDGADVTSLRRAAQALAAGQVPATSSASRAVSPGSRWSPARRWFRSRSSARARSVPTVSPARPRAR